MIKKHNFSRQLELPSRSFFLFGPRGVGKSTWLHEKLPSTTQFFNLLDHSLYLDLLRNPNSLESKIKHLFPDQWICIDEIQKIPSLLDEVHRLMEKYEWKFALSGSSARKLKRGGANLLAGRAITKKLSTFSYSEIDSLDLNSILNFGLLPLVVTNPNDAQDILRSYLETYLREEIKEEGLVRKTEPFIRFLEIAGLFNGDQINIQNIARDSYVPRSTVNTYLSILEDTLIIDLLPAYKPRAKLREAQHPKLYWFDPGVARAAAGFLNDTLDGIWLGKSFETSIFHELKVYNEISNQHRPIYFYRTSSGLEIDFIIELKKSYQNQPAEIIAIEVKLSQKWDPRWEKSIRQLAASHKIEVKKMIGIYNGKEELDHNGFQVFPFKQFIKKLFNSEIF